MIVSICYSVKGLDLDYYVLDAYKYGRRVPIGHRLYYIIFKILK